MWHYQNPFWEEDVDSKLIGVPIGADRISSARIFLTQRAWTQFLGDKAHDLAGKVVDSELPGKFMRENALLSYSRVEARLAWIGAGRYGHSTV